MVPSSERQPRVSRPIAGRLVIGLSLVLAASHVSSLATSLATSLVSGACDGASSTAHAQGGRRARRPAAPPPPIDVPECVQVRLESRQNGLGFSHAVIVTNRCTMAVQCDLATDADPAPTYPLRVEPNTFAEVVTRLVSPAPVVGPLARCRPVVR